MHDGSIAVNSKEGEGARFTIRLPLRPAASNKEWPPASAMAAAEEALPLADPADAGGSVLSYADERGEPQ